MGEDGDDLVSLPTPPPPRPAARREAIEAALRKFDGIEDAPVRPARERPRWNFANLNRRPAGALVAATLIAVIAIPAIRLGLPDRPPEELTTDQPAPDEIRLPEVRNEPPPIDGLAEPTADEAAASDTAPPPEQSPAAPPVAARRERIGFAPPAEERVAEPEAPAPMMAAPAPPPPPPPPPAAKPEPTARAEAQMDAIAEESAIVVTGSKVRRSNLEAASPVTTVDAYDGFLTRLRTALEANNRRAVIRLVALPLKVNFDGETRTYTGSRDIARDYDRIFTPQIRQSALALRPDTLMVRDAGRLKGNGRIWFGCGRKACSSAESIRIREIVP